MKPSKEILDEINRCHETSWDYGSWGSASTCKYKIKQYFTAEASQHIFDEAKRIIAGYNKLLRKTPASKRYVQVEGSGWGCWGRLEPIPELEAGTDYKFRESQECRIPGILVGNSALYVKAIEESYRSFKSCTKYLHIMPSEAPGNLVVHWAWAPEVPPVGRRWCDFGEYAKSFGHIDTRIHWDSERQRFYTLFEVSAGTAPIPDEKKKRNWARATKHKEFQKAYKTLQKNLIAAGVEIKGLIKSYGSIEGVDCFYPVEIGLAPASAE